MARGSDTRAIMPDQITDLAIEWMDKQKIPTSRFLLMCQHKAPHRNWSPHPRHFGKYPMGSIPEPESLFDDYAGRSSLLKENEMTLKDHFHWGHDSKFHGDNLYTQHFGPLGNGEYRRMNPEQKAAWDAYYEPENQSFLHQMKEGSFPKKKLLNGNISATCTTISDRCKLWTTVWDGSWITLIKISSQRTPSSSILRIRVFIWVNMAGMTNVGCLRNP